MRRCRQNVFSFIRLVLTLLTHIIILALYIHVPRFVESPGTDFVQFYGAALLSGVHPDKIYDSQSQMEIQRQFSAGAGNGIHWPYLHAPFFTVLLIPLRWFSYAGAFWLWTLFTVTLHFVSVILLIRSAPSRRPPIKATLAVAGAAPVLYWLILTGQTTAIALFIWTLAFVFMRQGRFYWAGFVFGLLSYRAQYLTIILPLLFLRRIWSGVFGFSTAFLSMIVLGGFMFSFRFVLAIYRSGLATVRTYREPHAAFIALCDCLRIFPAAVAAGMGALWRLSRIVFLDILVVEGLAWGSEL